MAPCRHDQSTMTIGAARECGCLGLTTRLISDPLDSILHGSLNANEKSSAVRDTRYHNDASLFPKSLGLIGFTDWKVYTKRRGVRMYYQKIA